MTPLTTLFVTIGVTAGVTHKWCEETNTYVFEDFYGFRLAKLIEMILFVFPSKDIISFRY